MKSDYITRAAHFLKVLFPYIKDCKSIRDYKYAVQAFNRDKSRKVTVASGCARVALITSDYVIKMDYDEYEVKRIGGCESEVKFYQFAKNEGFDYLFAAITPIEYMGHKFYVMPRVHGIGRYEFEYAEDKCDTVNEEEFLREYLYDLHDENYGWYHGHIVIVDYACNVFQQKEKIYA